MVAPPVVLVSPAVSGSVTLVERVHRGPPPRFFPERTYTLTYDLPYFVVDTQQSRRRKTNSRDAHAMKRTRVEEQQKLEDTWGLEKPNVVEVSMCSLVKIGIDT